MRVDQDRDPGPDVNGMGVQPETGRAPVSFVVCG
jgi:hypothetical protein